MSSLLRPQVQLLSINVRRCSGEAVKPVLPQLVILVLRKCTAGNPTPKTCPRHQPEHVHELVPICCCVYTHALCSALRVPAKASKADVATNTLCIRPKFHVYRVKHSCVSGRFPALRYVVRISRGSGHDVQPAPASSPASEAAGQP